MSAMHSMNFSEVAGSSAGWLKAAGKQRRHVFAAELSVVQRTAAEIFWSLRKALIEGRWQTVLPLFSSRLQKKLVQVELTEVLRSRSGALRKAYRDAGVRSVLVEGRCARLVLDWGRWGFEQTELNLVCERTGWRLDSVPWGSRLVECRGTTRTRQAAENLKDRARHDWARRQERSIIVSVGLPLLAVALTFATGIALIVGQWLGALGAGAAAVSCVGLAVLGGKQRARSHLSPRARPRR
jgi:hypothetical protein